MYKRQVFAFSSCGNDESDPDSTVTIAMATVEKQPQYDAPYLVLDNGDVYKRQGL